MADIKAGKAAKTGRELVNFNPELFVDDDDAVETIEREDTEEPLEDDVETAEQHMQKLSLVSSSSTAEGAVPIDESLFQDEDIPEDDDDDDDGDDAADEDDDEDDE